MKQIVFSAGLALSLILTPCPARAQYAVYDAASVTRLARQLDQMAQDYQKQIEQLDEAIKQTSALTGTRDMGSLANSALEAELRRYLPHTWQQTMDMIGTAGLPGSTSGAQSLYNDLYKTYSPMSGADFIPADPAGPMAKALDRRTNTAFAAMAASEQAYDNIAARIATYETMLAELNNAADLKASVDLQARIAAENGMILTELMRLKTIQLQQKAAEDNETLTNTRRAGSANKYDAAKAAQAFKAKE